MYGMVKIKNGQHVMIETRKKYFKITSESKKHIYQQLVDCFEKYISNHLPGDKIPSERSIATHLGVNRETVRKALQAFVDKGLVVRSGKGTFITKANTKTKNNKPHPLILQQFMAFRDPKVLKFALYEDLPNQKCFWNKVVKRFNDSQSDTMIEIEWVPQSIKNMKAYPKYLQETKPDIFLMGGSIENDLKEKGLLAELPDSIQNKLSSDKYWSFGYKNSIPIHFPCWGVFWNKELTDKYGLKDVKKRILSGELLEILHEASDLIKGDICTSGAIWNYLCSLGYPEQENLDIVEFLNSRFDHLKNHKNIFMISEDFPLESMEKFMDGTVLFYISTSWFVSNNIESYKFPVEFAWDLTEEGFYTQTGFSSIGIMKNINLDLSAKFAEYLISPDIQKLIVDKKLNCGIYKDANKNFMGQSEKDFYHLKNSINSLTGSEFAFKMNIFLMFDINDLYKKIMEGRMSSREAANLAYERWILK